MYFLKLILLVLFPIIHGNNIKNNNILQKFLLDYFEDKNVTITLKLCWNRDEINNLIFKLFNSKYPKQVQVNTYFTNTDFFNTMEHNTFVVLDITCNNANNILLKANASNKFAAPYKWLLIQPTQNYLQNVDSYQKLLNPFLIQIDSEVICTELFENNDILLWLYFKVNENRTIEREKLGKWNQNSGLQIQISHNITSFRRRNLYGSTIRIVSVMSYPDTLNNLENYKSPMEDTITKTQYGIVMALVQYTNATFYIIPADQWGVIDETGRWGGMYGYIQRKEADITGTVTYLFKNRLKIAKYLKLTNPSTVQFVLRKPPLSIEQNIYSLPFSWSVWISSISLIIIITLLFLLSSYFENPRNQDNAKVEFGNILLLMGAAVCQQGCDVVPTGVPGRILTLLVFTSFMFLYVSYSANIVALLQSSSESIKTMEDLLNSKNMKVGLYNISYNFQYFMNATDRVTKAIYKEKIGPHGFYELQKGIEKVRKGLFAFHVEEGAASYYILKTFEEHEKCDTISIPGVFNAQFGWLINRLDSPHTELFKISLYKIGEYGIQQKYFLHFYRKSQCYNSAASFTSVGITDFYPALLVFLYGLICALFIFFMEHLHHRYMKKQPALVRFNLNKTKITFLK